ncbi:MAG: hypothetical protein WCT05_11030 [Lentisphaeria bacterium]
MPKIKFAATILAFSLLAGLLKAENNLAYAFAGQWYEGFRYARDNQTVIPFRTAFSVNFDEKFVYFNFRLEDPQVAKLRNLPTPPHGQWPKVDNVELFLDPTGTSGNYFQLAAGVDGSMYDSRCLDGNWKTNWTTKVEIKDKEWLLTITLPVDDPLMRPACVGANWRFNVCRNVKNSEDQYYSTWALLGSDFHNPQGFAQLTFGRPEEIEAARKENMRSGIANLTQNLQKRGLFDYFAEKLSCLTPESPEFELFDIQDEALVIENLRSLKK